MTVSQGDTRRKRTNKKPNANKPKLETPTIKKETSSPRRRRHDTTKWLHAKLFHKTTDKHNKTNPPKRRPHDMMEWFFTRNSCTSQKPNNYKSNIASNQRQSGFDANASHNKAQNKWINEKQSGTSLHLKRPLVAKKIPTGQRKRTTKPTREDKPLHFASTCCRQNNAHLITMPTTT